MKICDVTGNLILGVPVFSKWFGISLRGVNGSNADQVVPYDISFHVFKVNTNINMNIVKYECGANVTQIQIEIEYLFNLEQIPITK
jgi:hypothetical protein